MNTGDALQRPSWDVTWLDHADTIAKRSLCVRDQVGAVIVDMQNRPLISAYNGPPSGFQHSDLQCDSWCSRAKAKVLSWKHTCDQLTHIPDLTWQDGRLYITRTSGLELVEDPDEFFAARGCEPIHELDSDYRDCPANHAEANAITMTERSSRGGGTIYVNSHSCHNCCKLIANSGLSRLVVRPRRAAVAHRDSDMWYAFLETCGLTVDIFA